MISLIKYGRNDTRYLLFWLFQWPLSITQLMIENEEKNRNRNKFLKNKRVQVIWGKLDSQHSPEQIESSLNSNAFKGRANQNCNLSLKNHPLASWVSMGVMDESTDENKDIYWKLLNRGVRTFLFTLSPSLLASFSPSHLSQEDSIWRKWMGTALWPLNWHLFLLPGFPSNLWNMVIIENLNFINFQLNKALKEKHLCSQMF